jgi:hypothetical protein
VIVLDKEARDAVWRSVLDEASGEVRFPGAFVRQALPVVWEVPEAITRY